MVARALLPIPFAKTVRRQFLSRATRAQMKGRSMNSSPPQIPVQPVPFEYDLPNLAQAIVAAGSVKIVA